MKINVKVTYSDGASRPGVLSTEHSSSSYGLPVLLIDGEPHGIADLPPGTIIKPVKALSLEAYAAIVRAGYRVKAVIRTNQDIDAGIWSATMVQASKEMRTQRETVEDALREYLARRQG